MLERCCLRQTEDLISELFYIDTCNLRRVVPVQEKERAYRAQQRVFQLREIILSRVSGLFLLRSVGARRLH